MYGTEQTEEIVKKWTDTQKEMWDNWLKAMQSAGTPAAGPPQFAEAWQKTIETWESNVSKTRDAQTEWTETWFNSLDTKGLPEQVVKWIEQGRAMMAQWQGTQTRQWQGWFDFVKQYDPATLSEKFQSEGQKGYEAWQATAQKMMDAQMELFQAWVPGMPAPGKPTNGGAKTTANKTAK